MPGIYVGDEDCIELEDGTRCYILHDLSQGAEDDLIAYAVAKDGDRNTIWLTKLLELAMRYTEAPEFFGDENGENVVRLVGKTFHDPTSDRQLRALVRNSQTALA